MSIMSILIIFNIFINIKLTNSQNFGIEVNYLVFKRYNYVYY